MRKNCRLERRQFGYFLHAAFALLTLAHQFTRASYSFRLLARAFFRRFFVEFPAFHFPESPFTLHFFLERFQGLFDIIVADKNLYQGFSPPRQVTLQIKTPRVGSRDARKSHSSRSLFRAGQVRRCGLYQSSTALSIWEVCSTGQ